MSDSNIKEERKRVSKLIFNVLTGKLCVREVILKYPKDSEDTSLMAAYHALVHYEADEDLRRRDLAYKEEQNDYLEFIAYILDKGDELPDNIIRSYDKYYKDAKTPASDSVKGLLRSLCRFLNV